MFNPQKLYKEQKIDAKQYFILKHISRILQNLNTFSNSISYNYFTSIKFDKSIAQKYKQSFNIDLTFTDIILCVQLIKRQNIIKDFTVIKQLNKISIQINDKDMKELVLKKAKEHYPHLKIKMPKEDL